MVYASSSEPLHVQNHWRPLVVRELRVHNTSYRPSCIKLVSRLRGPSERAEEEFLVCLSFESSHTLFSLPLMHSRQQSLFCELMALRGEAPHGVSPGGQAQACRDYHWSVQRRLQQMPPVLREACAGFLTSCFWKFFSKL